MFTFISDLTSSGIHYTKNNRRYSLAMDISIITSFTYNLYLADCFGKRVVSEPFPWHSITDQPGKIRQKRFLKET